MSVQGGIFYHLELSRSGGNACYVNWCDTVGHCPPYAACLNKIDLVESGEENEIVSQECVTSIKKKRCRAVNMRQEEELKGGALYYIPRGSSVGHRDTKLNDDGRGKGVELTRKRKSQSLIDSIDGTDFTDVINQVILTKEQHEKQRSGSN